MDLIQYSFFNLVHFKITQEYNFVESILLTSHFLSVSIIPNVKHTIPETILINLLSSLSAHVLSAKVLGKNQKK
jgi:hypothetical protein